MRTAPWVAASSDPWTSSTWPSHSSAIVRAMTRVTSTPRVADSSEARASRKSPVRIATVLDHLMWLAGVPRRVSAASMTSSWYSVERCTSSTITPPEIRSGWVAWAPPSMPDSSTSIGRNRLPPASIR